MTSVPVYIHTCIAPGPSSTSVYLVGVPVTNEGRLEVYTVDLSNINSPVATFKTSHSSTFWTSAAAKSCFNFESNPGDVNSPIIVQQFKPNSYFVNIYPNGTTSTPFSFKNTDFVSPKLCSITGSSENQEWVTAYMNATIPGKATNSVWGGMRLHATNASDNTVSYLTSENPTSNPLLSVGTYVAASVTMAQGYHTVFDTNGGGMVYKVEDSTAPVTSSNTNVVSLSSPQQVNMSGVRLTSNAIPITMGKVAYIMDQASDLSVRLYSLNPSQSSNLMPVPVSGKVPMFSSFMATTVMNGNIILYSISGGGVAAFNSFDTNALTWSGPNLMVPETPPYPPNPSYPSSPPSSTILSPASCPGSGCPTNKSPTGAIIGGVVGGLVLLAIAAFFLIRYRRNSNKNTFGAVPVSSTDTESQNMGAVSPMQQNKHQSVLLPPYEQQQQGPMQMQQWRTSDPYHLFNPQEPNPSEGGASPTMHLVRQPQQTSPVNLWSQPQEDATGQAHIQPNIYLHPSVGSPQQIDTGIDTSYSSATRPPTLYVPGNQIPTTSIASRQEDVQQHSTDKYVE
ncbi:hypothetical protein BGZ91_009672 [Linnemannia elongata]|nr:hypothetical protein BGZ91_009672 [Linnemannia elongata]KAG0075019.1 hypothetical protein BGZ90_010267 [Linnemannia elongata]